MAEGKQIYAALMAVQRDLKVPKGRKNTFGNYSYRSAEDILEAVKPILNDNGLTLMLNDTIEAIGARYYVKATATLVDIATGDNISTSAYAREPQEKKGADVAQVTGASSSYARKYALNGLFCIDDTKDADTDEYRRETQSRAEQGKQQPKPQAQPKPQTQSKKSQPKPQTQGNMKALWHKLKESMDGMGIDASMVLAVTKEKYGKENGKELTEAELTDLVKNLEAYINEPLVA